MSKIYNSLIFASFVLSILAALFNSFYLFWKYNLILLSGTVLIFSLRTKISENSTQDNTKKRFYTVLFGFIIFLLSSNAPFVTRLTIFFFTLSILLLGIVTLVRTKVIKFRLIPLDIAVLFSFTMIIALLFTLGQREPVFLLTLLSVLIIYFSTIPFEQTFISNNFLNMRYKLILIIIGGMLVLAIIPDFIAGRYSALALHFKRREDWRGALLGYQKAISFNPRRAIYYTNLADFYISETSPEKGNKNLKKAIVYYEKALILMPINNNLALKLSKAYLNDADYEKAIKIANKYSASADKIQNIKFNYIIIDALFSMARHEEAIRKYRRLIKQLDLSHSYIFFDEFTRLYHFFKPSNFYYRNILRKITKIRVQQLLADTDKLDPKSIIPILKSYYDIDKQNYNELADKVVKIAYQFAYRNDFENSLRYIKVLDFDEKVLDFDESNTAMFYLGGLIYEREDKYGEAIRYFEKLRNISPGYKYLNYHLGLCYARNRDFEKSIHYLSKAREANPDNISALNLLSDIYRRFPDNSDLGQADKQKGESEKAFHLIFSAELLPTVIGTLVDSPNSKNRKCLASFVGSPQGYLSFGPYISLPPGSYKAVFYYTVTNIINSKDPICSFDVFCYNEDEFTLGNYKKIFSYSKGIRDSGPKLAELCFIHSGGAGLQFRVETFGKADIYLDRIELLLAGSDA